MEVGYYVIQLFLGHEYVLVPTQDPQGEYSGAPLAMPQSIPRLPLTDGWFSGDL